MENEKQLFTSILGMAIGVPIWLKVAGANEAKIEKAPLLQFVYMFGGAMAGICIAGLLVYGLPAVFSRWTR